MNRIESVVQSERHDKDRNLYWKRILLEKSYVTTSNDCHCGCCQKIIHPVGGKGSDDVTVVV